MPRELVSQKMQDFLRLWRDTSNAIDAGHDRDGCLFTMELGLRHLFPPQPATDARLWRKCYVCNDTGYEIVIRHPPLYGGHLPIRFATPCTCERGRKQELMLNAYYDKQAEARQPKRAGWTKT